MTYQQSIHKLIIMLPLLQKGGDLAFKNFYVTWQRFVPGFRGFQLFLHILVVFQECLIIHSDPLHRCGRRAGSWHIYRFVFQSNYNYCTAHTPQMPPSSPSRWCECSWGSFLEEGFSEGPPCPQILPQHSGKLAVFDDLPGSAAAQGPATGLQWPV